MKNFTLAGSFVLLTVLNAGSSLSNEKRDQCKILADLARTIMSVRQTGVPITEILERNVSSSEDVTELAEKIIIAAYSRPAYSSENLKIKSVTDFSDEIFLACYSD